MQNKALIGIIVVLLVLIGVTARKDNKEIAQTETEESALEETSGNIEFDTPSVLLPSNEPGVVASVQSSIVINVWQSQADPRYVLEIASGNIAREYYARTLTNTGSWSFEDEMLSVNFFNNGRAYAIDFLDQERFSLVSPSGEKLSFNRVEL